MSNHELRDELSDEKLTSQPVLFKSKIDLDGKLVETIISFKDNETFENYLESTDENQDEGSIIVQEADNFMKKDKKLFIKIKRNHCGKKSVIKIKWWLDIWVGIVINQVKE